MFEALESRRLLSVAPAAVADDPAVDPTPVTCVSDEQIAADRAAVQQDMSKLRADRAECEKLLAADRAALKAATDALQAKLTPLREKLAADQAECAATLQADRKAIHDVYDAFQSKIQADLEAVHAAGTDPAKRHAALAQLEADRAALRAALAPLMKTLHDDTAECTALLNADRQAIADVLHSDTAVRQAREKLAADHRACAEKLAADYHQLQADLQKLREDLAHRCPDGEHHHDGDPHTA
jgi:chromosome segregation ATPase